MSAASRRLPAASRAGLLHGRHRRGGALRRAGVEWRRINAGLAVEIGPLRVESVRGAARCGRTGAVHLHRRCAPSGTADRRRRVFRHDRRRAVGPACTDARMQSRCRDAAAGQRIRRSSRRASPAPADICRMSRPPTSCDRHERARWAGSPLHICHAATIDRIWRGRRWRGARLRCPRTSTSRIRRTGCHGARCDDPSLATQ